jgi:hypothetical protein
LVKEKQNQNQSLRNWQKIHFFLLNLGEKCSEFDLIAVIKSIQPKNCEEQEKTVDCFEWINKGMPDESS